MNTEFRRNLWLELTLHRLIAMPAVLTLVFALVYAANADDPSGGLAIGAATFAGGLCGVWGARAAADSVPEEVRLRTWDAQRMSAIDPWAMAWGKLFGATAFAWYGGLICLAVLAGAAPAGWAHSGAKIAALIAAGSLLAQAAACLGGVAAARKGYARQGAISGWLLLFLLILLGPGIAVFSAPERPAAWWGREYGLVDFALASAAAFAAWALFGVYRAMCTELQFRTTPWAYAAFALFLATYLAGFGVPPGAGSGRAGDALIVSGLLVSGALTYLMLLSEQTGALVFRRVQIRLARGEPGRALEELPCWPVSLALAAGFCAAGMALLGKGGQAEDFLARVSLAPLPLFLLLLRDAAIYLGFSFARRPRRVDAVVLLYLALLYLVVPWLLHAAELPGLAYLVLPPVFEQPGQSAIVIAVHAVIAAAFVAWRWRAFGQFAERP